MPPDKTILKVIRDLIHGTQKGSISWEPESSEGDSFLARIGPGGVRISRAIAFSGGTAPLIIEFLDADGRTLHQHRASTTEDYPLLQELFDLAHEKALAVDETMSRIIAEIEKRAGQPQ